MQYSDCLVPLRLRRLVLPDILTNFAQCQVEGGRQTLDRLWGQMGHDSGPRASHLLEGQLDPDIAASVAIIRGRDDPSCLCSVGVVVRMVVEAIVG